MRKRYLVFSEANVDVKQEIIDKLLEVTSEILNLNQAGLDEDEEAVSGDVEIKKVVQYAKNEFGLHDYFISGHVYDYIFNIKLYMQAEDYMCVGRGPSDIAKFYKGILELYYKNDKKQLVYKHEISSNKFMQ